MKVVRTPPLDPDALAMIEGSERELSALYPPEVRFAFSPQQLVDEDVRFYVAFDEDLPVGCGGYGLYDGFAELKRIFVPKAFRGEGIADAIMAQLERDAHSDGITLMRLETGLASPQAIRFYERMGYTHRGPFADYEENGSSVFMEKSLTSLG